MTPERSIRSILSRTAYTGIYSKIVPFRPGTIIELDDPVTGTRHLAMVAGSGTEFLDHISETVEDRAPLLPIYDALNPAYIGDEQEWSAKLMRTALDQPSKSSFDRMYAFDDLVKALEGTFASRTHLALCRAILPAYRSGNCDIHLAMGAAKQAEDEARKHCAQIVSMSHDVSPSLEGEVRQSKSIR